MHTWQSRSWSGCLAMESSARKALSESYRRAPVACARLEPHLTHPGRTSKWARRISCMQSTSIASLLMTIVRESESVHVGMRNLLQAGAVNGSPEHLMARCELRHACNLLTSRIAELQRTVIAFDHEVAGNALQRLERLTASLTMGAPNRLVIAHSINAIDGVLADLRREVIGDGIGIPVASDTELLFRTARMIINTELDDLDCAIRRVLAADLTRSAKPEMWRSFLKALPLAKAELWRVTRI